MRTFVMGDVHGAHRAMLQVFERSGFDRENDRLIFLGDVCDGWPETKECIDELLTVKNLVALAGNHDEWFEEWVLSGIVEPVWVTQGGKATIESYGGRRGVPYSHKKYLREMKLYLVEGGRVFVHGGFRYNHPSLEPTPTWDRDLWNLAVGKKQAGAESKITQFDEIYIGHTSTTFRGYDEPVQACEVWNLDQGAGWEGKLSIMDIETKEFWQSDTVSELYPEAANARNLPVSKLAL